MLKKNRIALSVILALGFIMMATCSLFTSNIFNTRVAKAEVISTSGNFYMTDGAGIRVFDDYKVPSGIRWQANVSDEFYASVGADAEFGIIIDNKEIADTDGKYDVNASETEVYVERTKDFVVKDGMRTFTGSILYEKLAETLETEKGFNQEQIAKALQTAYSTTLYARGYVKVNGEYYLAESGDTARSIKEVARYCLISGTSVTANNQEAFESYAGGSYDVVTKEVAVPETNLYHNGVGSVKAGLEAGEYEVYVGAKKIGTENLVENGIVTTALESLSSTMPYGENFVEYINGSEVIRVPFINASHTIATKTDFTNFIASYSDSVSSKGWYAVLTTDINMLNGSVGKTVNHTFAGVFDGLGHSIDNIEFPADTNNYGVFGSVSGTIKNVAFTNAILRWNSCGLSSYVSGLIENVYVQGKDTQSNFTNYFIKLGWGNVHGKGGYGYVKNCLFDIDFEKFGSANIIKFESPAANMDLSPYVVNTYGIKHTNPYKVSSYDASATAYTSVKQVANNITKENGFNSCWKNEIMGYYFGDVLLAEKEVDQVLNTAYYALAEVGEMATAKSVEVDLATALGASPVKVFVNGVEVSASNTITLNSADFTVGEEIAIVFGNSSKLIKLPVKFVTFAISTAAQFKAYVDLVGTTGDNENSWYVILTQDINLYSQSEGCVGTTKAMSGTFDGLGNNIANFNSHAGKGVSMGLFGYIYGTFKNVSFSNAQFNANSNGLTSYLSGTIENVYVKGNGPIANYDFTGAIVKLGWNSTHGRMGIVKNCVFNISFVEQKASATVIRWNDTSVSGDMNTVQNCYAIQNGDYTYNLTLGANPNKSAYTNVSDFISNITKENGFNDYWKVEKGVLSFGTRTIG